MTALDQARSLCQALSARLVVATVSPAYPTVVAGDGYMIDPVSPSQWEEAVSEQSLRIAAQAEARLQGYPHRFIRVQADQIHDGILRAASEQACDLIVMASHGRRGMSALLLGSETTKVLTHSKIPVLVVR
jgi:nucleotide-binding universal stress UspA family protein